MIATFPLITPVILSGGSGTRLWPMSRSARPKQFLPLASDKTMFEATCARVADASRFAPPLVVANAAHADLIEEQLGDTATASLLLEPMARNTAPAIALAALACPADAVMLVIPSDHVIADNAAFQQAIDRALPFARDGWLVTFGIDPDGPETGYGYIKGADALADGVARVERFIEKPPRDAAEAMILAGGHYWNGGIFLFRADAFLGALAVLAPEMLHAAQQAMASAARTGRRVLPDADAFAKAPAISIDYAVMEKSDRVAVVPVRMGWSDLGSWDALYGIAARDGGGNALSGDVTAIDTQGCLIRGDGLRVTAVGVQDLIIVASGDSVLILPRGASQDVKRVYDTLPDEAK